MEKAYWYKSEHNHDAPEDDGIGDLKYISLHINDSLKVSTHRYPAELTPLQDQDLRKPQEWLYGENTTTSETGVFPGTYVRFEREEDVAVNPGPPKPRPRPRPRPRPSKSNSTEDTRNSNDSGFQDSPSAHKWRDIYSAKPLQCIHCEDFIWGTEIQGVQCEGCGIVAHTKCSDCLTSNAAKCAQGHDKQLTSDTKVELCDWTGENVREWMAVVHLYRYAETFNRHDIKGKDLINVTEQVLAQYKVADNFHRVSIKIAVDTLLGKDVFKEQYSQKLPPPDVIAEQTDLAVIKKTTIKHNFQENTFSVLTNCQLCGKPLLGIIHQGLKCIDCGLVCHLKCSRTNVVECKKLNIPVPNSSPAESAYGQPLVSQFDPSKNEAPPMLQRCFDELDRRAHNNAIEVIASYRRTLGMDETMSKLTVQLMADSSVKPDLDGFEPAYLTGVIKKYLRELPDPVIPMDMYQEFIEAVDSENPRDKVLELYTKLPLAYKTTVGCIMKHVSKLFHLGNVQTYERLSQVFCHLVMRPNWSDIIVIVHNAGKHIQVFELLLKHGQWAPPDTSAPPPELPPRVRDKPLPDLPPTNDGQLVSANIEDQEWYWGDISKEEVNEKLRDTPDGTYVVRNSLGHKDKGDYTLTLRKGGSNKLIKIFHKEGRYGFVQPLKFTSVAALIEHYKHNSLAGYNKALDITLQYPVSKHLFGRKTQVVDPDSQKQLWNNLREAHTKYIVNVNKFDKLHEETLKLQQEIQASQHAIEAFNETINVFEEQLRILLRNATKAKSHEGDELKQNESLLNNRLETIRHSQLTLKEHLDKQTEVVQEKMNMKNNIKPELKKYYQLREQHKSSLQALGIGKDIESYLESIGESNDGGRDVSNYQGPPAIYDLPHTNQANWYVEVNRQEAENMLDSRPPGTFLIRPRPKPGTYALSIVPPQNIAIGHCIIEEKATGFGFAHPYYVHATLMDLVLHYYHTSLEEHNDGLDVTLKYPVLASAPVLPSRQGQERRPGAPPGVYQHWNFDRSNETSEYVEGSFGPQ